jgi:hypothetical protein
VLVVVAVVVLTKAAVDNGDMVAVVVLEMALMETSC